jgi:membrane-associated protein
MGPNLGDFFLSALTDVSPLALGLGLFLGPLGLPIPTAVLVMAAGALIRQGLLTWSTALGLGLAASVLGDSASYTLGRLAGGWVERIARRRARAWQRSRAWFLQRGAVAVYLTRVLLTALDVPTNLIAGSSNYAFRRFLTWDLAGRATWLLLYGGLGYLFSSQWQATSQAIGTYGLWVGAAAAISTGAYCLVRQRRNGKETTTRSSEGV